MDNTEIAELVGGAIGILLGLLVIIKPRILAWVVGIYFIIAGVAGVIIAFN